MASFFDLIILQEHLPDLQCRLPPGLGHAEVVEDVRGETDSREHPVGSRGGEVNQECREYLG